jgi:hypothetical protein
MSYSFALSSASAQPSGTANFSRLECLSLATHFGEPLPWCEKADALLWQMTLPMPAGECITVDGMDVHVLPLEEEKDAEMTYTISRVITHRRVQGQLQFRVVYAGFEAEGASWQPAGNFFDGDIVNILVQDYCERVGVRL